MTPKSKTPLLDKVRKPADIRDFSTKQLKQLAKELRTDTVRSDSITGGHLGGGSLGVVELTVAIHHVFNTPKGSALSCRPGARCWRSARAGCSAKA